MMEQLGQRHRQVWQLQEEVISRCWYTSISFSFWWRSNLAAALTAATEEYTGAGAPLTKTITVS
jgi:hypothetical protein